MLGNKLVDTVNYDYTVPVTSAAWVEIKASLASDVRSIEVFDSCGQIIYLGYGPAGSEQTAMQILPGGNGKQDVLLNQGMRLALKAASTSATVGQCVINFYR